MRYVISSVLIWLSSSVAAQICDGKYDRASALITQAYARYGTLYSGGANNDSLGPTIEIYRLLIGLPDGGMAQARDHTLRYIDPPGPIDGPDPEFVHATMARSLPRIHDPAFRRDGPDSTSDSEVLLNNLTAIGPYPGWWLNADAPVLTPVERAIALHADDDALDWLLTVQAASARPYRLEWGLASRFRDGRAAASRGMLTHALDRYAQRGGLPWFLAVLLSREDRRWEYRLSATHDDTLNAVDYRLTRLAAAVAQCTASSADYVAFSIGTFEHLRHAAVQNDPDLDLETGMLLPRVLRRMAAVQLAKLYVNWPRFRGPGYSVDDLLILADDPAFHSWLNVGRSYRSETLEALTEVNAGVALNPKTIRLLNILSVSDLLQFSDTRQDFPDEQRLLVTAAFLRLVALGREADAAALVDDLRAMWPQLDAAITQAWDQGGSRAYRLAKVALAVPEPRTLLVPEWAGWGDQGAFEDALQSDHRLAYWAGARRSRDLPIAIRSGGFLARDFRVWMTANGSTAYTGWAGQNRSWRRGLTVPDVLAGVAPILPETTGRYGGEPLGIAGFAGWEELSQLGPKTGLANRVGRALVDHARARSSGLLGRFIADKDALGAEMELVIQQGRHMIHGDMDGMPLGQVAFAVLHGALDGTPAAQRTPYWYTCKERCEP